MPINFGVKLASFISDLPDRFDEKKILIYINENGISKFDLQSFYQVIVQRRPNIIFQHFCLSCDFRSSKRRDDLESIQFMLERSERAEIIGYQFDCSTHYLKRKKKYWCHSGKTQGGNLWFALQNSSNIRELYINHCTFNLPTLIGENMLESLKKISLKGSHNFIQLLESLQIPLPQIQELEIKTDSMNQQDIV